jgi:hypothetical protein
MAEAINIIIDEKRRHPPETIFVEIENDDGESIRIGERISDGRLTKIRITQKDITDAPCKGDWARYVKATDKFL